MLNPKLVVFDFGGTLFTDGEFNLFNGLDGVRLAADNPGGAATDELCRLYREIDAAVSKRARTDAGYALEIPLSAVLRNIFARAGLKVSKSLTECEVLFDRFNSERAPNPYIGELLESLYAKGIRTGVISNTVMSGEAMTAAIEESLPCARMDFVFTSADFLLCKPARDMFDAALKTTGVAPSDCLYCGDSVGADVDGAHSAGIIPVLYDRKSPVGFQQQTRNGKPYYAVNSWKELAAAIG